MKILEKNTISPLYLQVREYLLRESEGQEEYRFPSERQLCKQFGVSRETVQKALSYFVENDLVVRRPGKGTFLVKQNSETLKIDTLRLIIRHDWTAWKNDVYFSRIISGIMSNAANDDFKLVIEKYSENQKHKLADSSKECVLWLSPEALEIEAMKELADKGENLVSINRTVDYPNIYSVCTDHAKGAEMATLHLMEKGHRSILYIGTENEHIINQSRLNAFLETFRKSGMDAPCQPLILKGEDLNGQLKAELKDILKRDDRPSAIFLANGNFQIAAIELLKEMNLSFPEDISLISFDNVENVSEKFGISVVQQEVELLGKKAFEASIRKTEQKNTLISPYFIERKSVGILELINEELAK
jgi:DNA-binding LacI/PurR family transcriptional regulator